MKFIEDEILKSVKMVKGRRFLSKYVKDFDMYEELIRDIPLPDEEIFKTFRKLILRDVKLYARRL